MKVKNFEDLIVWQKVRELSILIYKHFKQNKDFGFRDQILRASVSIMNNIAEGFERRGNKEFKQFLFIAKGSCGEVRSMVYVAIEIEYISQEEFEKLHSLSCEVSRLLSGLIKSL